MDGRLLVKQRIASIARLVSQEPLLKSLDDFLGLTFLGFLCLGFWQTTLLSIVRDLAGGGSVAVTVGNGELIVTVEPN